MYIAILTLVHVLLSFLALFAGCAAMADLLANRDRAGIARLFLISALLTTVTGFMFPFTQFLPSHGVGIVALATLAFTFPARYRFRLNGSWRWLYAAGIVSNVYLLVFVLIAQIFLKIPAVNVLAPTLSEPPFAIAQGLAVLVFLVLGIMAVRRFRPSVLAA